MSKKSMFFKQPAVSGFVSSAYIEAELMTRFTNGDQGAWTQVFDANASNGLAMVSTMGKFDSIPAVGSIAERLEMDIDLQAGTYKIWISWITSAPPTDANSVWVTIGDTFADWAMNGNNAFPVTYAWEEITTNTWTVTEGTHTIKVIPREGMRLDRLYVTKDLDTPI